MEHSNEAIITEQKGDFLLELYKTQKGRYWAKAIHLPSNKSYISHSHQMPEDAVDEAIRGCIDLHASQ